MSRIALWRKVPVATWDSGWFQKLSPVGRLLFLLVTTGPQTNRCGLFRFSIAEAAERLDADVQEIRSELARLCRLRGWRYDVTARVLWIPGWWDENAQHCANEDALRGALKDLFSLPRTPLIQSFASAGVVDFDGDKVESLIFEYAGESFPDPDDSPHELLDDSHRDSEAVSGRSEHCLAHGPSHGVEHGVPDRGAHRQRSTGKRKQKQQKDPDPAHRGAEPFRDPQQVPF